MFSPEPVKYEKKDGQWYTHDGVDVSETQARKGAESADLFNLWICSQILCYLIFHLSHDTDFY